MGPGVAMTTPIIKLQAPATLSINYPDCSVCNVAVESDGDGYICPTCGTYWSYDDGDGDTGTLYEDWSGETLDLPFSDADDAWMTTINANSKRLAAEREEQNQRAATRRLEREKTPV
jgi:hypothetical protein